MATAEELKAEGFLEYRELVELVASTTRKHQSTVYAWLQQPINKVRGLLIQDEKIIQPDDRTWQCLYSAELMYFLVAYVRWHRFGTRHSMVQVVNFYNDFNSGEMNSIDWLPPATKKRFLKKLERPGAIGNVAVTPQLALVG